MGSYSDAVSLAKAMGTLPAVSLVRTYSSRPGAAIDLEQEITEDLGLFARASINDGSKEAYEFSEINRSLSVGLSLRGTSWSRPRDIFGLAVVTNELSNSARNYFAAGGLGILIGDGRLPHYGSENIVEAYYNVNIAEGFAFAADYQFIANPAYNRERGPVSVLGMRLHVQY
jgi:high affinity Mn2+ porin